VDSAVYFHDDPATPGMTEEYQPYLPPMRLKNHTIARSGQKDRPFVEHDVRISHSRSADKLRTSRFEYWEIVHHFDQPIFSNIKFQSYSIETKNHQWQLPDQISIAKTSLSLINR
jgi:hypothetical protein